ncbi:MAG: cyclopropane fatty acyl phospholipid synthase [Leptospirales bacterium]|nr:cyclopropane fatty acyl phospholipid synthase [Leptospirales bacterium]
MLREALGKAGIEVGGKNPWDIQVKDRSFYERIIADGVLGLGESYMEGGWSCAALDQFVDRASRAGLEEKIQDSWSNRLHIIKSRAFNLQKVKRAFQVGEQHYDLGNDLYTAMLDSRMQYTCGYWRNAKDLEKAQLAKLDLVCQKIQLKKGMHVLEFGCGWGGFARYAAERYGAVVTGYTVAKEQAAYAREKCRKLPVTIHLEDYRKATGQYDAVVSIGIMEHVGYRNYATYMETAERCLKDDGIAFVHTIGGNRSTTIANAWIHKYIFPNGMLPSVAQLGRAMEGRFVMEDWHNFGPDYDRTLMAWHRNFVKAWPKLKKSFDDRFYRMWEFYLLGSAGAFRARSQQLWQIVMTKEGRAMPPRLN